MQSHERRMSIGLLLALPLLTLVAAMAWGLNGALEDRYQPRILEPPEPEILVPESPTPAQDPSYDEVPRIAQRRTEPAFRNSVPTQAESWPLPANMPREWCPQEMSRNPSRDTAPSPTPAEYPPASLRDAPPRPVREEYPPAPAREEYPLEPVRDEHPRTPSREDNSPVPAHGEPEPAPVRAEFPPKPMPVEYPPPPAHVALPPLDDQPQTARRQREYVQPGQVATPIEMWPWPPSMPQEWTPRETPPGSPVETIPAPMPLIQDPLDPPNYAIIEEGRRPLRGRKAVQESSDIGIGYERLATAPFVLDIARPMNHVGMRLDSFDGWQFPDAGETLWARPSSMGGRGPAIERATDVQDFVGFWEMGGPAMSVRTSIPIRLVDPQLNADTGGMGDMGVTTKTRILGGDRWTITQVNNLYFPTGSAKKGLGTGHVSIEPGLLCAYKWRDDTYLHGMWEFMFPVGGHPTHSGPLFKWGCGLSHLLYDTDCWAVIPTIETVLYSVLDGEMAAIDETGADVILPVDGSTVPTLHAGVRLVSDTGGDLGLIELGLSGGCAFGGQGWYDSLWRIEMRIMY